jgi:hypothetical protein
MVGNRLLPGWSLLDSLKVESGSMAHSSTNLSAGTFVVVIYSRSLRGTLPILVQKHFRSGAWGSGQILPKKVVAEGSASQQPLRIKIAASAATLDGNASLSNE